jgi:hypothetical protein
MDALLSTLSGELMATGYVIQSDGGTQVVLAKKGRVNHILHFILTVISAILAFPIVFWAPIWLLMILLRKEDAILLSVVNGKVESRPVKPKGRSIFN